MPIALTFAFIVLCTMNAAGYRYGASDQAFYIPAVLRHVNPALFPRDAPLIDSQARLTVIDEGIAALVRVTGIPLPLLFLALYLGTLALLAAALLRLGTHFYRSRWATIALLALLTLRHSIAKTGANTLESYFHPRQLAFALGLWAIAMFLERRDRAVLVILVTSILIHPTTAMWFTVWLTVAIWIGRPERRRAVGIVVVLAGLAGAAILMLGPLAGRLVRMDAEWLAVIADKDYLFPLQWPLDAWLTNLVTVPVIVFGWRARARARLTIAGETPVVLGALALLVLFLCWLPFDAARIALAVQLQTSRVFWMLDLLASIYLVWMIAEGRGAAQPRRAAIAALVVVLLAGARGVYSGFIQFPNRPLFTVDLDHGDWGSAMKWARATPSDSGWLADPVHAALYGSSLRAAGERDVLIEQLKDTAIAMYDRNVAMRVADRERALRALAWDTPDGARALARRYDLEYLVIDRPLALPLAHQAGTLYIYRLR